MIAVTFENCTGMFHEADGDIGVVMCAAQGFEELCSRKDWRLLAQGIADIGLPVLRFDYAGTGDASGDDYEPARKQAWIASVQSAIEFMRLQAGVKKIVLAGLRLGAALAAEVAQSDDDVCGYIALHPVVSGKAYARELNVMSKVISHVEGAAPPADGIEIAGFAATSETLEALKEINLAALERAPAALIFICAPQGTASSASLAARWSEMGSRVTCRDFANYPEWMSDPTMSRPPIEAIASVVDWIAREIKPLVKPRAAYLRVFNTLPLAHLHFTEETVSFGGDKVGVLCQPTLATPGAPTIVFTNAGRNYHIGWARMFVAMARDFAQLGIASLRIDVSGIGDSPNVAGRDSQVMYCMEPIDDLRAAITYLETRNLNNVAVVGLCSGAHLAFHTALRDERIAQLVMINLQKFVWKPGMSLEVAMRESYRSTDFYKRSIFRADVWMRALRGDIKIIGIAREMATRTCRKTFALFAARLGKTDPDSKLVRDGLQLLTRRGVKTLLIYSDGDAGIDEFSGHFGSGEKAFSLYPGTSVAYLVGADHNLTPRNARAQATNLIASFVTGRDEAIAGAKRHLGFCK